MKHQILSFLAGMGSATLSEKRRKLLGRIFVGSLLAHLIGMLIFGGVVVMRATLEQETVFVSPPPSKTYEPRQLEHKVKVQQRQRSSSRPSIMPRMVAMKTSDVALPKIEMDAKVIHTSFQPKFKAVSGRGMGVGLGTGYGLGGFGTGVTAFDFFGIRGRGDKIAILVDVSVSMVEDERGGVAGFARVKNRISKVIDALSEQAMFNVVAFADAASIWQPQLMVATKENRDKAKDFLAPFNTDGKWGLTYGNVNARNTSVIATGGTTRLDLALTAAFEQGADTVLIISDGLPRVQKGLSDAAAMAHEQTLKNWGEKNRRKLEDWAESEKNARWETERVWIPPKPAVAPRSGPPKEGQPGNGAGRPATPGRWVERRVRIGGSPRPKPPEMPDPGFWTLEDFVAHLTDLYAELYETKGKPAPVVHTIGYQIDRDGGNFLRKLARKYEGKYRRVARID